MVIDPILPDGPEDGDGTGPGATDGYPEVENEVQDEPAPERTQLIVG